MTNQEDPRATIAAASRVVALSATGSYLLSTAIAIGVAAGSGSDAPWYDGLRWALYMGAAAAVAMSLGLIFAIPRSRADFAAAASERYSSNSNLEQISDWLTKLLVGAGLVQLSSMPAWFVNAGAYLGASMSVPNAGAYCISALVFGAGVGFLAAYLWTRLRLRSLLEAGDWIAAETSKQRDIVFDELVKANAASDTPEPESALFRTADSAVSTVRRSGTTGRGRVLWVDDHPENNTSLVAALRELNIQVDLAVSTAEALQQFDAAEYALVITDLGRTENGQEHEFAGEELIKALRERKSSVPVFVYASARGNAHRERLTSAGATFVTNRPTELLSRAVRAVSA